MEVVCLALRSVCLRICVTGSQWRQRSVKSLTTVIASGLLSLTALAASDPAASELLRYVPDDVVIVVAAQPARMLQGQGLRTLLEATKGHDVQEEIVDRIFDQTGFHLQQVAEIGLVIDLETLNSMKNESAGLERLNGLRQIGLAMHNFHDVFGALPDDDGPDGGGDAPEQKGHLSWRVHLLPFLEQGELYEQFHLDEPWDSEHNKTLIELMPEVFRTAGVEEAGKTAMHVLLGEGTAFGGNEAPAFRSVTDGTSNTIMAVIAGSDTADIWTKPGGPVIDASDPLKALGKIGDQFEVLMMDGSVRFLSRDLPPEDFLHLVQPADGEVIMAESMIADSPAFVPGFIVHCREAIDQKTVRERLLVADRDDQFEEISGVQAQRLNSHALAAFPTAQTMLVGTRATLAAMLEARGKSSDVRLEFESIYPSADIAAVVHLEHLEEPLEELGQQLPFPGLLSDLTHGRVFLDLTGDRKEALSVRLSTSTAASSMQISGLANGGYQMLKAQAIGAFAGDSSPESEAVVEILSGLLDPVVIKAEGSDVFLEMPKPENSAELLTKSTPVFEELFRGIRSGREAAEESRKLDGLREIALAMHICHDAHGRFPAWNRSPEGGDEPENLKKDVAANEQQTDRGLSWRVHLLPFLDEVELYEEFHLDEDWDSEHNRTLIEKMPQVFACEGVEKAGHTCIHVFMGEETPFGGHELVSLQEITDGVSNTIMVVQAGVDTGDVWTRPGGLKFDATAPKKSLGAVKDRFMLSMCDGSVRFVNIDISDETLSRLIRHCDGEVPGEF